ncbi:MAG: hypothetical protein ACOX22_12355 [Caldicoprobacterales bacterium]|jgi:hypothetical protein|nr:hypothetical protein [Clostridiales bacterium]
MKTGDMIKEYTMEANLKLYDQFTGTRDAIYLIAEEKAGEFILVGDVGLNMEEKQLLADFIARSMMQSFALGYGVGKVEGKTKKQIYL